MGFLVFLAICRCIARSAAAAKRQHCLHGATAKAWPISFCCYWKMKAIGSGMELPRGNWLSDTTAAVLPGNSTFMPSGSNMHESGVTNRKHREGNKDCPKSK